MGWLVTSNNVFNTHAPGRSPTPGRGGMWLLCNRNGGLQDFSVFTYIVTMGWLVIGNNVLNTNPLYICMSSRWSSFRPPAEVCSILGLRFVSSSQRGLFHVPTEVCSILPARFVPSSHRGSFHHPTEVYSILPPRIVLSSHWGLLFYSNPTLGKFTKRGQYAVTDRLGLVIVLKSHTS